MTDGPNRRKCGAQTGKGGHFERDAQSIFKGTHVRQDTLYKANGIEEQNPQSASALYVPLPHLS
jgi:hypothetical protein